MIRKFLELLIRAKDALKKQECTSFDVEVVGGEVVEEEFVDDGEPLTWAEQKNIRKELRRFQLWHALRVKVPKGFEEGV